MKYIEEFFEIFDRDDFTYRKGDEETKELFQNIHGKWKEWSSTLGLKYYRFDDKPDIKQWQNSGALCTDFWTRFKYTPFKKSATCVSFYVTNKDFVIELSYEYTNLNSELTMEKYNELLLENLDEWIEKYNVDTNLFYIYYDDGEGTKSKHVLLNEYLKNINEYKSQLTDLDQKRITVGVLFGKKDIEKLDTESKELQDIVIKLSHLYEKVQIPHKIYDSLLKADELIPSEYDGSYELVKEIVNAYKSVPLENLTMDDLNAVYFMAIGTFKRNIESKKELIRLSNLDDSKKQFMFNLLDETKRKSEANEYKHFNQGHVGMFGCGFMTFNKKGTDDKLPKEFIKLCIDLSELEDDFDMFERASESFKKGLKGIQTGTASTFLHCLKPYTFPIINGKEGEGTSIYEELGLKLKNPLDLKTYIENAKEIKKYRDKYFTFKNYRVIDLQKIGEIIVEPPLITNVPPIYKEYSKEQFLSDAFITEEKYNTIVNRLNRKNNIILQGAPGVGKSYLAKKIVYSILGKIDEDKVQMIQFHQSYSYEDFIMGYRPNKSGGFDIVEGVFYKFCKKAIENQNENFYFIIDEINRGNLSKIFGELMLLIECDKRGEKFAMSTVYSEEKFYIPDNLYIIGLMNTADRSLALIDYALRRRFSFIDIEPAFGERFDKYTKQFESTNLNKVLNVINEINYDIEKDESLGKGFKIGHSYFCNLDDASDIELLEIIECDIIPLLEEYWIENTSIVEKYAQRLNEAISNE